eukprot:492575-Prymnesium_polylepis.1
MESLSEQNWRNVQEHLRSNPTPAADVGSGGEIVTSTPATRAPDQSWPTAELRAWLRARGEAFDDKALHMELVELVRDIYEEERAVAEYQQQIAARNGPSVITTEGAGARCALSVIDRAHADEEQARRELTEAARRVSSVSIPVAVVAAEE